MLDTIPVILYFLERKAMKMDKRELLVATLNGENTERIPCGFWHHFSEENSVGTSSVQAHLDFFRAIDADILKVMNEHLYVIDQKIDKPEDWKKLTPQAFVNSPYPAYIEEFKAIKKALPAEVPIFATVHGVLVSAYHATQLPGHFSDPNNLVSRHLRQDPESVANGLQSIADTLITFCNHLVDAGVDGIYYAALGGESYRFTPEIFNSYVKPFDEQIIKAINDLGTLSILHICKDQVMLPLYQGISASIVNWATHECSYDLRQGRRLFPNSTLLGGFDDRSGVLVDGTISEIGEEVEAIVALAGREHLIFGADCTLPNDVDLWRLRAVRKHAALI
jgi:uroporphyrinogen decarboxylase